MFIDAELILDPDFDLTSPGLSTDMVDTGAPHADSKFDSGGSSEGHNSYGRVAIIDDLVGGDVYVEVVAGPTDAGPFSPYASRTIYAGTIQGDVFRIPIPGDIPRFVQMQVSHPGAAPTTGRAFLDLFHG